MPRPSHPILSVTYLCVLSVYLRFLSYLCMVSVHLICASSLLLGKSTRLLGRRAYATRRLDATAARGRPARGATPR